MHRPAFVTAIPSITCGLSVRSVATFVSRQSTHTKAPKRARLFMLEEYMSIPEGYVRLSKERNGRAPMVMLFLALVTATLTGELIVSPIGAAVKKRSAHSSLLIERSG